MEMYLCNCLGYIYNCECGDGLYWYDFSYYPVAMAWSVVRALHVFIGYCILLDGGLYNAYRVENRSDTKNKQKIKAR